jgi:hypothetical protein
MVLTPTMQLVLSHARFVVLGNILVASLLLATCVQWVSSVQVVPPNAQVVTLDLHRQTLVPLPALLALQVFTPSPPVPPIVLPALSVNIKIPLVSKDVINVKRGVIRVD